MNLKTARQANINRLRSPASLRAVARELLMGNKDDWARAREFARKAKRIERELLDSPTILTESK